MNHPLEDRIRRSFVAPAGALDSERLLRDVRRGAARRRTRRRAAVAAATVVVAAGSALAAHTVGLPHGRAVVPTGHDRHGTVSGFWAVDADHAVRVTQERCGTQWCSRIWTGDGQQAWRPAATLRWPGRQGEGTASGPVSLVRLAPGGRDGWAWGSETWATGDGGASWRRLPSPEGDGPREQLSTTVTPDGRAWGLGLSPTHPLFTAAPGSRSWRPVTLPRGVRTVAEVVGTTQRTAALVQTRTGEQRLVVGSGGLQAASVAPLPCPGLDSEGLAADREAFFAACAATSRDRAVLWSSVDGRRWRRVGVVPRRGLVGALTGVGARAALVTVDRIRPPFPTYLVSLDGVTAVTPGPGRGLPLSGQFRGPVGTLVVEVDARHTALVRSRDGGRTWHVVR